MKQTVSQPSPSPSIRQVVDFTTRHVAGLFKKTFDALREFGGEPEAAAREPSPTPAGPWMAGEVMPLPDAPEPLETVLGAFDQLFDPRAPLSTRRNDSWTLLPDDFDRAGPTVCPEARALEEDGAKVLRLRHNGAVVAVAAIHRMSPSPAVGLRRAS